MNKLDKICIKAFVAGLVFAPLPAFALGAPISPSATPQAPAGGGIVAGNGANFSSVASNIVASVSTLPGLLSGLAYMFGLLLGVFGIMKLKEHVDNSRHGTLKEALVRFGCGGALMAMPIVFEAMKSSIGDGQGPAAPTIVATAFNIGPSAAPGGLP